MSQPEDNPRKPASSGNRLFHMGGRRHVQQQQTSAPTPRPAHAQRPQAPGQPPVPPPPRRPAPDPNRIPLPFEQARRRSDVGEWVYRHRVGLLVTVVLYLIAAILFVSYKIVVFENPTTTMYVDLVDPEEPEQPEPEEQEKKPVEEIDPGQYEQVMNRASDQNAKMDVTLKDDRGTQADKLLAEAERVQQELAAGQQAFRSGMDEIAAMSKRSKPQKAASTNKSDKSTSENQTVKVQGNVTVSYDLAGRTATYLHVPAYQCREGGTVVVGITVNRNGEVIGAEVEKASPGECIAERALQAARASSFNADGSAPERQRGTITYVFVAQ
ncbi:energy transducer TonB family protein [Millionella massiliensis]|uniref:energy transducer TonB family protein n=1 Tax=Millionella massiliensis TaxID=1871023 RepID=UPI0024B7A126|nr:energy transducer TonB [Millionella massiliensis]